MLHFRSRNRAGVVVGTFCKLVPGDEVFMCYLYAVSASYMCQCLDLIYTWVYKYETEVEPDFLI